MTVDKFLKIARNNRYFETHRKVLVALSGGQDSMTLWNWMEEGRESLGIELGLAHVNYQSRVESNQEEESLKKMAASRHIPIFVRRFSGDFSEASAREFRYNFFKEVMDKEGYTALVTAHHKNDQVETFLMRTIMGRRLRYLSGIKDYQSFPGGVLIRPLLQFEKVELDAPIFFEDQTNSENDYFRNRVRNQLIPEMSQENSQLVAGITHLSEEVTQVMEIVRQKISDLEILKDRVDLSKFLAQTKGLQSFIFQEYVGSFFPDLSLTRVQLDQILHILRRRGQYRHPVNSVYSLIKTAEEFYIIKTRPLDFLLKIEVSKKGLAPPFDKIYLPPSPTYQVRKRAVGDKIRIHGVTKKLGKYFIDAKVNLEDRERWVIAIGSDIYAIPGLVVSDLSMALENDTMKQTFYVQQLPKKEKN